MKFLFCLFFLAFNASAWTDDPIIPKKTPIKSIHITEIRQAIEALACPAWDVSDWSVCTGGSAQWTYSAWGTCGGGTTYLQYSAWGSCSATCGGGTQSRSYTCRYSTNSGTQSRNGQCTFNPLTGTQTRMVSCKVDGAVVDDSLCATSPKPSAVQWCTPSNPALCGPVGSLNQNCTPTGGSPVCSTPVTAQSCNTHSCCSDTALTPYRTEYNCRDEPSPYFACTFKYCDGEFVYPYMNSCTGYREDRNPYSNTYVGCF